MSKVLTERKAPPSTAIESPDCIPGSIHTLASKQVEVECELAALVERRRILEIEIRNLQKTRPGKSEADRASIDVQISKMQRQAENIGDLILIAEDKQLAAKNEIDGCGKTRMDELLACRLARMAALEALDKANIERAWPLLLELQFVLQQLCGGMIDPAQATSTRAHMGLIESLGQMLAAFNYVKLLRKVDVAVLDTEIVRLEKKYGGFSTLALPVQSARMGIDRIGEKLINYSAEREITEALAAARAARTAQSSQTPATK